MNQFDVLILGAGGAGMMCAIHAASRGRRVALLDMGSKPGGKIIISGGGRCNFTNLRATYKNYVSKNQHFCRSALSRYLPEDFIQMVKDYGISYHERKHGQLFCDETAQQLIDMLVSQCKQAGAEFYFSRKISSVKKIESGFEVETDHGNFCSQSVVVATGGLSIPKMGATGIGYEIAKHFGHTIVETAPALDGFTFATREREIFNGFSGVALEIEMSTQGMMFRENVLFTHVGLSGPTSLQVSLHWNPGETVSINFLPQLSREELYDWFMERKSSKAEIKNVMLELLPKRLSERFVELYLPPGVLLPNITKIDLQNFCEKLQNWTFIPQSTVGYNKAEVTRGGVNTDEVSSKTMESKKVSGLYFIGEVLDVTGWLGGFNYQWAWASGAAAGEAV
jgi:predicted Rossmann fold flavoprotein